MASIYVVILDMNVQSMLARTVAGVLSDKLETEVKIKTFYIKPNLKIYAEELQINDKQHYPMIYVGKLDVRLLLGDIMNDMRVRNLAVDDLLINFVKYENSDVMNISELFSSSEKKNRKKDKLNSTIYIDELILSNGHVVVWNQNRDKPEKESMDYSHIDVDSINFVITEMSFDGDAVKGYMNSLSASEKSGFKLDEFDSKSQFEVSSERLDFKNLNVKTHATSLDLDLQFLYNGYSNFRKFVDSIMIVANIRPSQLTLSDLKYFAPTMAKMTDTLQINGLVTGFVRDFTANNFNFSYKDSTNFEGTIKMKGLPDFFATHIVGDVERMNFTYQDIAEFAIPTHSGKIPLPEMLSSVTSAKLSGEFYGFHNNFNTTFNLHTNLGNIYMSGALNNDLMIVQKPYYFMNLFANNLNIAELAGLDEEAVASMEVELSGEGLTKSDADLELVLNVGKLKLLNNEFDNFDIHGNLNNQKFIAYTNIDSELLKLDFNGTVDISDILPSYKLNAKIENADLYKLNLLDKDKTMLLSTNASANFKGDNIDRIYGSLNLDNTLYTDSRGSYFMDNLNVNIKKNYFNSKDISVNCDFFDMEMNGIINFKGITNTFKNYVMNHFHINRWSNKGVRLKDNVQDFYVNLELKNTETLSRLLMPQLGVSENTNLTATFTSDNYQLYSTVESSQITYNNFIVKDIYLKNKTDLNKTTANVRLDEFVIKEETPSNPVRLSLENVTFSVDAHNDSLLLDFVWDDDILENKNKGLVEAFYVQGNDKGLLHISANDIIVNDSSWSLSPTCYIEFKDGDIHINEFDIFSGSQSLNVKGYFPKTSGDTLYLNFDKIDVSNIDLLTSGYGIDVDGIINGGLQLSGLQDKLTLLSNLSISNLGINDYILGKAFVDANWNAPDTSIFIDTEIIRDDSEKVLQLIGNYYKSRNDDNIDFNLDLKNIDISLVNGFTKGVLSKVSGKLDGNFLLSGSLKKPVITGDADLVDAACKIDYLNTYYKINPSNQREDNLNRHVRMTENRIYLHDILLVDTLDNKAVANGVVTHDYLRNFVFDIDADLDNFLGMNMLYKDNTSFYGTAIASGDLDIYGPLDDIVMNINAQSMPGTTIDIILTSTSSINDNFIIFVEKDKEQDSITTVIPDKEKDRKFTFNLNADVTQDAKVNIHLPSNMGNISAKGSGNIRLGLAYDQLSLYGDYVIDDGTFNFNFQNLVRRNFSIKQGGTITWTGSVSDADINVTGSYRTKSSISSLGIEMDSTSLVNNVNVDCILHLQEKLTNPSITFGLSLPNATDDIKNTVFSIIDTTNQALMSQQIISLLVLGSFSYSNANLYSIGASNYYNVLTSSLSSWLSQISKDFDVGVRYTPEDNITAEELDVALSTQLFDDKLTIEGNFGMYTGSRNEIAVGANSIVGDLDITYKITNRFSLKFYNHSNLNSNYYSYSYEAYSAYTQGIGISYSQSFDSVREIFARKNRNRKAKKEKDVKIKDEQTEK